jgi:hypothetical protein
MPDIAGEILKGNLSVVAPGREDEAGPGGLDAASTKKLAGGGPIKDLDLDIGGAPNRSPSEVAKMIDGIDATLGRETEPRNKVSQRDSGMER